MFLSLPSQFPNCLQESRCMFTYIGTGTLHANRVEHASLKFVTKIKKKQHENHHQITDKQSRVSLVRYNDNSHHCINLRRHNTHWICTHWICNTHALDLQQHNHHFVYKCRMNIWAGQIVSIKILADTALACIPLNASLNNAFQLYRLSANHILTMWLSTDLQLLVIQELSSRSIDRSLKLVIEKEECKMRNVLMELVK